MHIELYEIQHQGARRGPLMNPNPIDLPKGTVIEKDGILVFSGFRLGESKV